MPVEDLRTEIENLRREIESLREENDILTEKAEDIFLLGTVSERIGLENTPEGITAVALESISTLKDIHYCAHALIKDDALVITDEFSPYLSSSQVGRTFHAGDVIKNMIDKDMRFMALDSSIPVAGFIPPSIDGKAPNAISVIPMVVRGEGRGIYIFVNYVGDSEYLRGILPLLERIVEVAANRIEIISLNQELQEINRELEARVRERTEMLIESEEKYRSIFNEARDGIVLIDAESGRIMECNPEFERQTGRPARELKKMKIWDIRPPDKREAAREKFLEIREKGVGGSGELELMKPDGQVVPVEFASKVIKLKDRRYTQSICRDISERVSAEAKIRKQAENLAIINRIITNVSSTLDLERVLYLITRSAAELVKGDGASIALYDEENDIITYPYHYNMPDSLKEVVAEKGRGLAGEVIETKKSIVIDDYPSHPKALKEFVLARLKVLIAVPLITKDRAFGALGVFGLSGEKRFSENDLELLEAVGRQAAIAIENARLYEESRQFSESLELKVRERTLELEKKNAELERFNRLFVDREFRIKELRDRVRELEARVQGRG